MSHAARHSIPPCILFEDEHLLVVNKPAGWNTHAPSPFASEGIYDWLKHREPRWANLAIIHRLDKETSGVMVFGKTPLANRSLTEQFSRREVRKKYVLLAQCTPSRKRFTAISKIIRVGERYASGPRGELAETHFEIWNPQCAIRNPEDALPMFCAEIAAEPFTGRTHQIRVHAVENGFPILGDTLYGGGKFHRVGLHAAEIALKHPASGEMVKFSAPVDFSADTRLALRNAIVESEATNAFRLIHGASDGWPGWYVEKLGEFLLSQSEHEPTAEQTRMLIALVAQHATNNASIYHKSLTRHVRGAKAEAASPRLINGERAPEQFVIRENGVNCELSFNEGYSVGLFLDQRDNRRRLLTRHVASDFSFDSKGGAPRGPEFPEAGKSGIRCFEILNCFAYTCGFSVCAALGGARTTSLDLSKKYLEWGKRNFTLNGLDPAQHDFIYGDVFDWLKRFAKKQRAFNAVLLDPPTFSQSEESGVFRAEKDYARLVGAALPVLKPDGILFASTNAADFTPEDFLARIHEAIRKSGRKVVQQHYAPQPPDFPVSRAEPAYLKTVWLRVA